MRCSLWLEEVRPWSDTATTRRSSLSLSLNSAWWCAEAQHTGHQSLRLRHDSIFARLPAINWQFRHIGGSHTVVGRSLSPVRRRGTLCRNVYATLLIVLPFFGRHLKTFVSQTTIRGFDEDALYKWASYIILRRDTVSSKILRKKSQLWRPSYFLGSFARSAVAV